MKTLITAMFFCLASSLNAQFQYTVTVIPYNPFPYDTGTPVLINLDDMYSDTITLPFTFNFYGNNYNEMAIGVNGLITFNISNANSFCPWSIINTCPSPGLPLNAIFGPYHDIDPSQNGHIYFNTYGVTPDRKFVISWDHVPLFSTSCSMLYATHQIVLHETSNIIDVNIQEKPTCLTWNMGNAVLGIQDHTGNNGIAAPGCNTGQWSIINGTRRFTPPCSFNNIAPDICMVTVDSLSQFNIIMWDKTAYAMADSFFVYRETSTDNYQRIGAVPYDSLSMFIDTVQSLYFPNTGNPNTGTFRYKLQLYDSCGNYSPLGMFHNTIFIINNDGDFSWPQLYTIENSPNPVDAYILMRDDFSNGNWHPISSVAGTQQAISDPNYSSYRYSGSWRVQTQWSILCNPTMKISKSFNRSVSNIAGAYSGIDNTKNDDLLQIYPNPASTSITILSNACHKASISILNISGATVFQKEIHGHKDEIDISLLLPGVYIVEFSTEKWITQKKLIKD